MNNDCRVACFTDTHGAQSSNGVGRFLDDLLQQANHQRLPFFLVAPGKRQLAGSNPGENQYRDASVAGDRNPDRSNLDATSQTTNHPAGPVVEWVRAPSFALPVYSKVNLSVPLEHHRRSLKRRLSEWAPGLIHVSTPGPFGCLGLSLAHQMNLPVVGIYHTDFPRYAEELACEQIERLSREPAKLMGPLLQQLMPVVGPHLEKYLGMLDEANPEFSNDLTQLQDILTRNWQALNSQHSASRWLPELAGRFATQVVRRFYKSFTMVLARSSAQQKSLQEQLGLPPERIRLLPPGTDTDRFHPRFADTGWRSQFTESADDLLALYVGRFTSEKNFGFLLNVWRKLKRQELHDPPGRCRLLLAGFRPENWQMEADDLRDVHWLGGLSGDALSTAYASSDLLLFPSRTETLGQVGLESMASGTPVIASDEGGPSTYIEHQENGWLLDATNVQQWVNQILQLSAARPTLQNMGLQAREDVAQRFTIGHSLDAYWQLHQEARDTAARQRQAKQESAREAYRNRFLAITANGSRANPWSHDPAQDRVGAPTSASQNTPPPELHRLPGILMISDYHAGRRYGTSKHRAQKVSALEAMLEWAAERRWEVVYGGDFGDHGANPSRQKKDLATFREIRSQILPYADPVFVRGNHDFGYSDQQIQDMLGGCRVQQSLVWHHEQAQITITHGHILGLARTMEMARQTIENGDRRWLEQQLTEEALDEVLKPSVIAYDLANLMESFFESKGLSGLSPFWEGLFSARAALAERLTTWTQHASPTDRKTWKLIASLLGAHDDTRAASSLGQASGAWATLFGHTHEPFAGLSSGSVGEPQLVLGNSGNMNRRFPTCVVARFPMVCVLEFDSRSGKLKPRDYAELDPVAAEAFLKRQTSTASLPDQPIRSIRPDLVS